MDEITIPQMFQRSQSIEKIGTQISLRLFVRLARELMRARSLDQDQIDRVIGDVAEYFREIPEARRIMGRIQKEVFLGMAPQPPDDPDEFDEPAGD